MRALRSHHIHVNVLNAPLGVANAPPGIGNCARRALVWLYTFECQHSTLVSALFHITFLSLCQSNLDGVREDGNIVKNTELPSHRNKDMGLGDLTVLLKATVLYMRYLQYRPVTLCPLIGN